MARTVARTSVSPSLPPPTSRPRHPRKRGFARSPVPAGVHAERAASNALAESGSGKISVTARSCPTTSRSRRRPVRARYCGVASAACRGRCSNAARWFESARADPRESRVAVVYQRESYCHRKCVHSRCLLVAPPRSTPRVSLIGDGPRSRKPRSERTRAPSHPRSAPNQSPLSLGSHQKPGRTNDATVSGEPWRRRRSAAPEAHSADTTCKPSLQTPRRAATSRTVMSRS